MEKLFEKFYQKLHHVSLQFIRSEYNKIHWNARLIGIKGARGVGKTTLILQHIKKTHTLNEQVLYISLDDIWFSGHSLVELADIFVKRGGKYLYLDEVHKYKNWSVEIKNIYDDHPELHIIFTGSSLLEILNARADLSRRAVVFSLQGLSFREYLAFTQNLSIKPITLDDIIHHHITISNEILKKIKPLRYFSHYLKNGYYPFFKEEEELYHIRIEEILNMILQIELPLTRGTDIAYIHKLKKLLLIIAESAPFIPNISKLSERIGINRNTLIVYLTHLKDAGVIHMLYKDASGITRLQKPDKIFLENTNLSWAIHPSHPNVGNLRETFFVNQLNKNHLVTIPQHADFLINNNYIFEIGGKNKSKTQINTYKKKAFIALDDIEYGSENKIPLWMFGFLY